MTEIELKFELPPEAQESFGSVRALAGAQPERTRLFAMYFDTPGHELAKHEMAMRLRRSGRRWQQCLKAGASGTGGLHSREEWELDRPNASIDLSLFASTPLAKLPEAENLHRNLNEIFRVEVARTTWQVELEPGTRVEVALDRGTVRNANGTEPISEIEIESVEGEPLAVFDFAEKLVGSVPLMASAVTKAQRGYRLARRDKRAPVKPRPAALEPGMTTLAAARASIAAGVAALQANEAGALASSDPEYVHQMRVALRRIRSAVRVFRDVLEPAFAERVKEDLKAFARATGDARDLDVFATETLPPIARVCGEPAAARSLAARVAARRRAAREAMRERLLSPEHTRTMLAIARWLAQPAESGAASGGDLREYAAGKIRSRHKKLVAHGKHAARLAPAARHRLRIEAKKLRYAVEGFGALFPRKRVKAYVRALGDIQEDLGRANDAVVGERLLDGLAPAPALESFARGWLVSQAHASVARLEGHFERLAQAKRFWEKN